jgi:multidrug efflux pump subunit AcrB
MKEPFFVKYKNPLLVIILLILIGGGFSYVKIKSSLFPQITFPKIKIIADAGQQPIDQMTVAVTRPLEEAIKQVPDLEVIKSITSRGSCEISAFMSWNANIDLSQQQIEARINQISNQLPPDVNIMVEKMNPSILPVMGYSLSAGSLSPSN